MVLLRGRRAEGWVAEGSILEIAIRPLLIANEYLAVRRSSG